MIEYDGYLDRSRLSPTFLVRDSFIQKDFFQILKELF